MTVVGITGTSGKTTTTYLVEAGLRAGGRVAGLIGTIGIRIDGADIPGTLTTPEAPALQAMFAAMAERGVDTAVMEVSSHALTLGRVDGTHFAVGGFTNLSRDHLDFHPTMADYFEAKAVLFDPASPLRAHTVVVCIDDDAGREMAARAGDAITVSATGQPADWRAMDVTAIGAGGQEFTVVDPAGVQHRVGIRATGQLQRRELSSRTGDSGRGRSVPGTGVTGTAGNPRARAAGTDRFAARISLRWSTMRTSPARCGRC